MSGKAARKFRKGQKTGQRDKVITMTPDNSRELTKIMKVSDDLFRKKFGRDPQASDPVIWDPDEAEPVPIPFMKHCTMMLETFDKIGYPDALLYAWAYTGFMQHPLATGRTDLPHADVVEYEELVKKWQGFNAEQRVVALLEARERVRLKGAGPSPEELAAREDAAEQIVSEDDPYYQFCWAWLSQCKVKDTHGPRDIVQNLADRCRPLAEKGFGDNYDEGQFGKAFGAALTQIAVEHGAFDKARQG